MIFLHLLVLYLMKSIFYSSSFRTIDEISILEVNIILLKYFYFILPTFSTDELFLPAFCFDQSQFLPSFFQVLL